MDAYQEKESVQDVNTADDIDLNQIEKDTVFEANVHEDKDLSQTEKSSIHDNDTADVDINQIKKDTVLEANGAKNMDLNQTEKDSVSSDNTAEDQDLNITEKNNIIQEASVPGDTNLNKTEKETPYGEIIAENMDVNQQTGEKEGVLLELGKDDEENSSPFPGQAETANETHITNLPNSDNSTELETVMENSQTCLDEMDGDANKLLEESDDSLNAQEMSEFASDHDNTHTIHSKTDLTADTGNVDVKDDLAIEERKPSKLCCDGDEHEIPKVEDEIIDENQDSQMDVSIDETQPSPKVLNQTTESEVQDSTADDITCEENNQTVSSRFNEVDKLDAEMGDVSDVADEIHNDEVNQEETNDETRINDGIINPDEINSEKVGPEKARVSNDEIENNIAENDTILDQSDEADKLYEYRDRAGESEHENNGDKILDEEDKTHESCDIGEANIPGKHDSELDLLNNVQNTDEACASAKGAVDNADDVENKNKHKEEMDVEENSLEVDTEDKSKFSPDTNTDNDFKMNVDEQDASSDNVYTCMETVECDKNLNEEDESDNLLSESCKEDGTDSKIDDAINEDDNILDSRSEASIGDEGSNVSSLTADESKQTVDEVCKSDKEKQMDSLGVTEREADLEIDKGAKVDDISDERTLEEVGDGLNSMESTQDGTSVDEENVVEDTVDDGSGHCKAKTSKSKMCTSHLIALGKSLEELRTGGELCDITLITNDTKIKAHKLILCASSPVLQSLIKAGDQLSELNMTSGIRSASVEVFIHYLYTGELELSDQNMTDLKKLADQYSVDSLKTELEKAVQYLNKAQTDHSEGTLLKERETISEKSKSDSVRVSNITSEKKSHDSSVASGYFSVSALKSKVTAPPATPQPSYTTTPNVDNYHSVCDSVRQDSDDDNSDDGGAMDYDDNSDEENEAGVDTVDKAIIKREPVNDMDKAFDHSHVLAETSLSARLADLKRERETSCVPPKPSSGSQDRSPKISPKGKACDVQVTVEKLPPTINPSVTVHVSDDDLADSEIEFVPDKSLETSYSKRDFTLDEKEQIALEAKRYGTTQTSRARNIPLPDILSWMTFFGLRKASENVKHKLGKQVNHEAELSIVRWIVQQQELNGSVNLDAMRNYALAVYRQSQPTFVASKTWLANFFKRNISVLQGTNFVHGAEEESEQNESIPVPVKLTQIPVQVDPALASIESQIEEHQSFISNQVSDQNQDGLSEYNSALPGSDLSLKLEHQPSSTETEQSSSALSSYMASVMPVDASVMPIDASVMPIDASVMPTEDRDLGGISKELLAKIRSKPIVIGTAVMFDAKTERKLAEWLIEKQQKDGYVYRDDFIGYAKSCYKGNKRFNASSGWVQLFMRRNSIKLPLIKEVVFKSKFKNYYTDAEKTAIVQQARQLGVPHVSKLLGISSGVIHSWKVVMDAEDRKKGGPMNYEKVTRSVTRAFPAISKEVDECIDSSLKERIKATIDIESKRRNSTNPNRGPDPELENEAIQAIKQAEIVRYQDVQRICYEVYSKKRPDFMASKSWVLKFVHKHLRNIEGIEILNSWFSYPEKNQLRLKYDDKMQILEEEKINGVDHVASMRNISSGTIRFWKKYPPSPEDDPEDDGTARKVKGQQSGDYEYVASKFQAGKKVRRRVVIGEAVMFTAEMEKKLVQWIHDNLMADNSIYTDDFRQYAKSIYNGDKPFSASSTWLTKFVRRNQVLREVKFISKYKRYFTDEEKYEAVMEARRFGTSYVAKKLNSDSGLINSWKIKFAKYSAKKMARLKQSVQLNKPPLQSVISDIDALSSMRPPEIENPNMTLEEIENEVGSGLHSHSGVIPIFEREIIQLIYDEDKENGGVTYDDISRLCRSVYIRTRPHFKASQNWTRDFIKRHEDALKDVNIVNRKKLFVEDDDEPLNHSTARLYKPNQPVEVSPILQKIIGKKPILIGQSRTLEPKMERMLVQWMVEKQESDGYVFMDEFNEYAKSLYRGSKKFAATQAWRIKFFRRNKTALKHVNMQSKYRKQFTREEKMAIVSEARRLGIGHVARKLNVNSSLIYSWGFGKSPQLKQNEVINDGIEQDVGRGLFSQRGAVPTLENDIVRLIQEKQNKEGSVSYDDIRTICRDVYQETRPSFKASYNWTMDFIKRHKEDLKGVDIENMKKVYYENEAEQPGLASFISTLNQNMDTHVSDSMVQIENLERGQNIDFDAHSYEESDLNLQDLLSSDSALGIKQERLNESTGQEDAIATSSSILERIRASKPEVIALPKTFDMQVEQKMVDWLVERQSRDAYVFTDDFIAFAKSLHTGPDPFSGSQTWRKNFLRRHQNECKHIIFRSKHVNSYTETEKEMVVAEARKLGVGHVSKKLGLDHRLVWSWKVKADQETKIKQNAFWKGPKKPTSVISKPLNIKQANANLSLTDAEPLGDAFRGVVPEFEDRIIKMMIEHQNKEGSISYDEISEISRSIYQETKPNFKAGYGWIKNFLQRHKNKLKNIDIENMKKVYLPDDDSFVPASSQNIRDLSFGNSSQASLITENLSSTTKGQNQLEPGSTLESLQRIIAKKPIILGTPKSFNIKTEKKLVQWLLEQQAEQGYAFIDEFKEFSSSLYTGDKKFAATNAWRTQFFRRNHAALKHVKLVSKFRKTFTEEEKLAIIKEAKRLGVGHVARQLDISHGNINVWMRELDGKGSGLLNIDGSSNVSNSSNSSFTGLKQKDNKKGGSVSRQASRDSSNLFEGDEEENEVGSGLCSVRGIVPIFENKIIENILEYYNKNESIKYDDISRISQLVYKETRPSFKASHNWIKDFMGRHEDKLGHLVIQNAREFLTQKEKREVLAEVEKHGVSYVSKITNISTAQLMAWKDQLNTTPNASSSFDDETHTDATTSVDGKTLQLNQSSSGKYKYSLEDKKRYAAECEKHGIPYVFKLYGVPKSNLGRWMKQFRTLCENVIVSETKSLREDLEDKVAEWIMQRNEEIGVVVVQQVLDYAQATVVEDSLNFVASEEWLLTFIKDNSDKFKDVKFRYPEEVAKNFLNFTKPQKDRLCVVSNSRPIVEVAAMAGIYPHTLYDWRKWYKKKQLQAASDVTAQTKTSTQLLVPKTEPIEPDGKSKMQDKLLKIESKYNAIQKQEIADEARKAGTSNVAKKHGIPLPLVLKWMKMFPETISDIAESSTKLLSCDKSTPKSTSKTKSTPSSTASDTKSKSRSREKSLPKSTPVSKLKEAKSDTGLKVKLPSMSTKYKYNSRTLTPEEKKKFVAEFKKDGVMAVSARHGIPKSTLYLWSKSFDDSDAASDASGCSRKDANSSKSSTPDISIKKESVDLDSFTTEQKREIALETKSLGFEETAKKRGLPTATIIEWMGIFLDSSSDKSPPASDTVQSTPPKYRVFSEEERRNVAEQALKIGVKETVALTGIHMSNVRRWSEAYKKKLKEKEYRAAPGERGQSYQNVMKKKTEKITKRNQLLQDIVKESNAAQKSSTSTSTPARSDNLEIDIPKTPERGSESFSLEEKLKILESADEIGVKNTSKKFNVDTALIFQWRKLHDYTDSSLSTEAILSSAATSSTPIASTSQDLTVPVSAFDEFESIVISDDEGSLSPCSNHSWQSDDVSFDTSSKRKFDFEDSSFMSSSKKARAELSDTFGTEDNISSDIIDFAYTQEQKQRIVSESNMYGLETVSKITNIPVSLIISWKAQFPNANVKLEKQ